MGFPAGKSGIANVLRLALVFSVLFYPVVASLALGWPAWQAPWIPSEQDKAILLVSLGIVALADVVVGWLIGSLRKPPRFMRATAEPAAFQFTRFIIGLALIECAAIFGLVLSFVLRDSRYAVVFAAPAVVLMLLVPGVATPRADLERDSSP
jgi:F0F1-type ATP synthase membrane subunit c/vacuolar-type H+-ATPase subunit K